MGEGGFLDRFNEAALFRTRKGFLPCGDYSDVHGFNEAALFRTRKAQIPSGQSMCSIKASMRPRSFERGKEDIPSALMTCFSASMRPRSFERGKTVDWNLADKILTLQ